MTSPSQVPLWEADGFAAMPEWFIATGDEIVVRAYNPDAKRNREVARQFVDVKGSDTFDLDVLARRMAHGTSFLDGNCFFVPSFGKTRGPIRKGFIDSKRWTGAYLDRHLNAFIWGNDYHSIAIFELAPGTPYRIGPIGQGIRRIERWINGGEQTVERNWAMPGAMPSTEFRQVSIDASTAPGALRPKLLETHPILPIPAISPTIH